jgi:cyclophilin family peptidyl-prolyl cis-trans isomerase
VTAVPKSVEIRTLFASILGASCFVASLSAARAEDLTPPAVRHPIADMTVKVGAAPRFINLMNTFGLQGVTQEVVRFTTTLGPIDVELFPATTPNTVANFLGYVDRGSSGNGGYDSSLIQRSVLDPPVIQGGSYYLNGNSIDAINLQAMIKSEAGIPNNKGTIAMALSTGPDSAQDAWYFNLVDNNGLNGTQDGGPFTVFGRAIENGLDTIGAIAALTTYNLSDELGSNFLSVPLVGYNPSVGLVAADFVYTDKIASIPLMPANPAGPGLLHVKVSHNSHPALVTATLTGQKLKLAFPGKHTGMATITLKATDAAGEKVKTTFTVKVEE